jgi:hypothetical protein
MDKAGSFLSKERMIAMKAGLIPLSGSDKNVCVIEHTI